MITQPFVYPEFSKTSAFVKRILLSAVVCVLFCVTELTDIAGAAYYLFAYSDDADDEIILDVKMTKKVKSIYKITPYLKIVLSILITLFYSVFIVRIALMVRKALTKSAEMRSRASKMNMALQIFILVPVVNSLIFLVHDSILIVSAKKKINEAAIMEASEMFEESELNFFGCTQRIGEGLTSILGTSAFFVGYFLSCISYLVLFFKRDDCLC